jgi:hypothetical protein
MYNSTITEPRPPSPSIYRLRYPRSGTRYIDHLHIFWCNDSMYVFVKKLDVKMFIFFKFVELSSPLIIYFIIYKRVSLDSAVSIATVYMMDYRGVGVRVPVESRIFSSPRRPDRFSGPPSLLCNG